MGGSGPPCNTWCLGPMRAHNPNGTSIGSAVFAQMTAECPYTLQWFACFRSKLPLHMLASGPHVIRGSLGPPESWTQMATWSFQQFLRGSLVWQTDRATDRPTDRPRCSERIHHLPDPRLVCKFVEIWLTGSRWNRALDTSPKNKTSPRSLALASAQIAPKIYQGQRQTMYCECPKCHPNRFTSGEFVAERVNTVKTHHKVNPILGLSYIASRRVITCWKWIPVPPIPVSSLTK